MQSATGRRRRARKRQHRVLWGAGVATVLGALTLWLALTNRFPGTTVGTPPRRAVVPDAGLAAALDANPATDGATREGGAAALAGAIDGGGDSATTRQSRTKIPTGITKAPSPTPTKAAQQATQDDPPPPNPGQAAYDEGRRRFLANDVMGAIEHFERAARSMPRNAQVHRQLGRAYMRAGDVDRAGQAYGRYLELAPNAEDRAIIERLIHSRAP